MADQVAGTVSSDIQLIARRHRRAVERRQQWSGVWRDCYAYALPQREGAVGEATPGSVKTARLFDGTAPDGVERLAASLLAELTPPWSRWFALIPGRAGGTETDDDALLLEDAAEVVRAHFERSNFAVEIHQAFLDLVTVGTASLLFEEAAPGAPSAFRFAAVPLGETAFEEGPDGRLSTTFRRSVLQPEMFRERFPAAAPAFDANRSARDREAPITVVEAVTQSADGFRYHAFLDSDASGDVSAPSGDTAKLLAEGRFVRSPFVNFRWMKAPGEIYGRSPIMKALPDIKTANKVVELVLKNATIAVTGIWQADDDGVLNPATIELVPGTIIPKAVGSSGLTPLEAPGRFDVSEIVLEGLRGRIRSALMADDLGPPQSPGMTATEVLERTAATGRRMGATLGRLQAELLTPLVERAMAILVRRGEIPPELLDRDLVEIAWRAPLARAQTRGEARDAMLWLESAALLGPEAAAEIDAPAAMRWLAKAFGVPPELLKPPADDLPPPETELLDSLLTEAGQ